MEKTLDLDTFGEIMDDFIKRSDIKLLIEMPEGTQEATVTGTGVATLDFYIQLNAIIPTLAQVIRDMGGKEKLDTEGVLDGVFEMMKHDIIEKLGVL